MSSGIFSVTGAGADVWGTADQFEFAYRRVSGDATIVARLRTMQNVHAWTKAGVMIRESLSAGSKHAFAFATPSNGIGFQRRTSTGGLSEHTSGGSGTAPVWLKLERRSTTLTAYRSSDGATWTQIGASTVSMGATVYVGLAVTSHNVSVRATATFSNVLVDGLLPAGWTSQDIGAPAVTGLAGVSNGTYTIDGAGADIWGTSDQFRYAYRQMTGDVDVVTRVASLQAMHSWTKAGVMIRQSLNASAAHASLFISGANGVAFQSRPSAGGTSVHTSGGAGQAPVWLKLTRRGSTITAYRSADNVSWTMVGQQTLSLPASFYVGLAVVSHDVSRLATATFDNVTIGTAGTPVNQPPTVSLTAPANGATYLAPATIGVSASASDTDGTISRVDFYAGATLIGSDTASPYSVTWSNVSSGGYSLTAVARDNAGATTTSAARTVTVSGSTQNQPPDVSLTSPQSGGTYSAPASIGLAASASDPDGSIARVEFYAGTTLVATDTSSPFAVSWNNVPAGTYALTAVARDNAGATTVSGARDISVLDPNAPNVAVFTASSNHETAVDRYVLEIFTAGADPSVSNPVATQDLGKPPVTNGECTVDIAATIAALPPGTYFATVTAIGSGGSARSAPSATFAR